jgi:hypothetical protein
VEALKNNIFALSKIILLQQIICALTRNMAGIPFNGNEKDAGIEIFQTELFSFEMAQSTDYNRCKKLQKSQNLICKKLIFK